MDHLCYFFIVFVMLLCLLIATLWSMAWKGLTPWLSFVVLGCVFVSFPCDILGQVWYLIFTGPTTVCISTFLRIVKATSESFIASISNLKYLVLRAVVIACHVEIIINKVL